MRTVALLQARMGSSRLPGKVMLPLDETPMLGHEIQRARAVPAIDEVVVAAPAGDADDVIERYAAAKGTAVYRGTERDVLGRLARAARARDADVVLRVSCDNPLIAVPLLAALVEHVRAGDVDYASSKFERTFPTGVNADAMTERALSAAASRAEDPHHREHVGQYFKAAASDYDTASVRAEDVFGPSFVRRADLPALRLTVDELPDYRLLYQVYDDLDYDGVLPTRAAIEHARTNGLAALNADVSQEVW